MYQCVKIKWYNLFAYKIVVTQIRCTISRYTTLQLSVEFIREVMQRCDQLRFIDCKLLGSNIVSQKLYSFSALFSRLTQDTCYNNKHTHNSRNLIDLDFDTTQNVVNLYLEKEKRSNQVYKKIETAFLKRTKRK